MDIGIVDVAIAVLPIIDLKAAAPQHEIDIVLRRVGAIVGILPRAPAHAIPSALDPIARGPRRTSGYDVY